MANSMQVLSRSLIILWGQAAPSFTKTPKSHKMFKAKDDNFNDSVRLFHFLPISLKCQRPAGRHASEQPNKNFKKGIESDSHTCSFPGLVSIETTSKTKEKQTQSLMKEKLDFSLAGSQLQ